MLAAACDNHDHLKDKATLAALSGVSPAKRLSGRSQRRRLNRGGNRQVDAALFRTPCPHACNGRNGSAPTFDGALPTQDQTRGSSAA
ncbi:transposase [Streptomyces sp. UNOB3_S3]|uniref:transposase n=1 Tax=Streptomyces sp. UNOB3_S3 TaxID=2871682 RepID=UPI0035B2DDDD|nr:transposase [Streptomyces sp. UNOB3_S3]